jgi:SAM-dependent methyltransferase
MTIDILSYNREAWNHLVSKGNEWTVPVTPEEVARARKGDWRIVMTPLKAVPRDWFPRLEGAKVLGLASGGGQQGPILAAAGADMTIFDNSPSQLAQDKMVAEREGLTIHTMQGDMRDLSVFADESFDLVVHPCSNLFVPDVKPVWREAYRVLKKGGTLISGFSNPIAFTLDPVLEKKGVFQIKYKIPYSDLELSEQERKQYTDAGEPLCFGHTLEDQIGGQIEAGFVISGFFEDKWSAEQSPLSTMMPCFVATRAKKP